MFSSVSNPHLPEGIHVFSSVPILTLLTEYMVEEWANPHLPAGVHVEGCANHHLPDGILVFSTVSNPH